MCRCSVPFFNLEAYCCFPIHPLCVCHLQKPSHKSLSPEVGREGEVSTLILRALCSTQRVQMQPLRKQSHPSQSWNRDSTPNVDPGLSNEVSVRVLRARRYLLNRYIMSLSVC